MDLKLQIGAWFGPHKWIFIFDSQVDISVESPKCKILPTNLNVHLTLPGAILFEHAVFLESTPWKLFQRLQIIMKQSFLSK